MDGYLIINKTLKILSGTTILNMRSAVTQKRDSLYFIIPEERPGKRTLAAT